MLELYPSSKIHPVFHVLCLKKRVGDDIIPQTQLPNVRDDGRIQLEPVAILERRMVKRHNRSITQVLVHWTFNMSSSYESEDMVANKLQAGTNLINEGDFLAKDKVGAVTSLKDEGALKVAVPETLPKDVADDQLPIVGMKSIFKKVLKCLKGGGGAEEEEEEEEEEDYDDHYHDDDDDDDYNYDYDEEEDDDVGIIGVYGMGGVGKTTLLTQIKKKLLQMKNDFDVVIWVVDLQHNKIQQQIGEQIGLFDNKVWEDKNFEDKASDIFKILEEKKFVLLMDGLWERVDLTKVGVPLPDPENSSKIVFSTRSLQICSLMEADKLFKVKCLRYREAWKLFKASVGDETLRSHGEVWDHETLGSHLDVRDLRDVCGECRGLPLALISIGRTMASKKTPEEWSDVLGVLRRSTTSYSEQSGKDDSSVKMHYWIHDMSLWIASKIETEEGNCFFCPDTYNFKDDIKEAQVIRDNLAKATSISLRNDKVMEMLRDPPRCPLLQTLFLIRNGSDVISEDHFFNVMPSLKVLNLSSNYWFTKLPRGISELLSLQHLDLSGTKIQELPTELRVLKILKCLNLEETRSLPKIPRQLISEFSMLHVLRLWECGFMLQPNEDTVVCNDAQLLIEELLYLKNLSMLSITLNNSHALQRLLSSNRLQSCIQSLCLRDLSHPKSIKVPLTDLRHLNTLEISNCKYLGELEVDFVGEAQAQDVRESPCSFYFLHEVIISNCRKLRELTWLILAPNLKHLRISDCEEMEEIINVGKLSKRPELMRNVTPFSKLKFLTLTNLPKLRSIYWTDLPFPDLKAKPNITGCPDSLVPPRLLKSAIAYLPQLQRPTATGKQSSQGLFAKEKLDIELGFGAGAAAESYPERPEEADCLFYLRTGFCGYGSRCQFNHPRERGTVMGAARATGGDFPERVGQPICQYFMRTGTCKLGASCKYRHPRQGAGSVSHVSLNRYGYPLRPGDKECSYYVRTGKCKFGVTCKFHHPQPAGVQVPAPSPAPQVAPMPARTMYPTMQSQSIPSVQQYGVVIARPSLMPGSYVQGPVASPGTQPTVGSSSIYGIHPQLSASAAAYPGSYQSMPISVGLSSSNQKEFPERPGQPECQYFLRTGDCKFGSSCRYHHPREVIVPKTDVVLSPLGLPLRPGAPPCIHYAQRGVCKFGSACKFDHPMGALSYSPSASSLADMPVAPYPVGASIGTLAPLSSSSDLRPELISGSSKDSATTRMSSTISTSSGSVGSIFSKRGPVPHSSM
ncbi:hypothetical protein EZV62_009335 [Acer yangbiense]|uniref:C3H1-type domain-containing protein n=1 Tax=Acer yangbiense TaxID=1000413 RepID=A0A5C7IFE3_9ROSI|nr:hypothetical protein EZV62_009335 [Acer yangbiense]